LPSFSGKNFKLWTIKMEGLLGSVDLWQFVQDGLVNPLDKRKDKITLYLISSTLDKSILSTILYEFGEADNAKEFWNALEMKYSVRESKIDDTEINEDIVVENGGCVESLVIETETQDGSIEGND
jgi:hypothetical protein